jgi:hypothetical protein
MSRNKPSGNWGASRVIRQRGKKNSMSKEPEANSIRTLDRDFKIINFWMKGSAMTLALPESKT